MRWLTLLIGLPASPSRHRVAAWRKLRRMGAVNLRGAAWILPETPETTELFQWLVQGSTWVTRPRPHIDRIASAWLIKRFIDPQAKFLFADPADAVKKGVPFDLLGAAFGHHGEDCTFETLLKRSGLTTSGRPSWASCKPSCRTSDDR